MEMEGTYWSNKGKYQDFEKDLSQHMPRYGYTSHEFMNAFICMTNIYYDLYNNGLCNFDVHKNYVKQYIQQPYGSEIKKRLENTRDFTNVFMGNEDFSSFENVFNALLEIGLEQNYLLEELEYYFIDSETFLNKYGLDLIELEKRKIMYTKLPLEFIDTKTPIAQHYINFKDGKVIIDEYLEIDKLSGEIILNTALNTRRYIWSDWDAERKKAANAISYLQKLYSFNGFFPPVLK